MCAVILVLVRHNMAIGHLWGIVSRWSIMFSQLLHHVLSTAFASKPPRYTTILELDQKVREFGVPDYLKLESSVSESPGSYLELKRWVVLSQKEWVKWLLKPVAWFGSLIHPALHVSPVCVSMTQFLISLL